MFCVAGCVACAVGELVLELPLNALAMPPIMPITRMIPITHTRYVSWISLAVAAAGMLLVVDTVAVLAIVVAGRVVVGTPAVAVVVKVAGPMGLVAVIGQEVDKT